MNRHIARVGLVLAVGLALMSCKSTQERLHDILVDGFQTEPEWASSLCAYETQGLLNVTVTAVTNSGSSSSGSGSATVTGTPILAAGMPATGPCSGTIAFTYSTVSTGSRVTYTRRGARRTTSYALQVNGVTVTSRTGGAYGAMPGAVPGMPGAMPGTMPGAMPGTMPGAMPGMPGTVPAAMPGMPGAMPTMPTGGPNLVNFQTYCQVTGQAFCAHCTQPSEYAACIPAFVNSCIGTRGATNLSTASPAQMAACAAALGTANCATVMAGTVPPACNNQ